MAKYGMVTTIPYGSELFEVTGVEYCEWEDAIEKIDAADTDAMEWATYDVLMNNGYLVKQPSNDRTVTGKTKASAKTKGTKGAKTRGAKGKAAVDTVEAPDADNLGLTVISGDTREPVWTQSRILAERDKLLREREKITTIKEKALSQKVLENQILTRMLEEESQPTTSTFMDKVTKILVVLMIIGFILFVTIKL